MILLTLISSRQKTMVNLSSMLYTAPNKLGTEIVYDKGSVAVIETSEEIYKLWHESCTNSTISTNSTNIVVANKNNNPINNTNSDNIGDGYILVVNDMPIPVDPSIKANLWSYCKTNEELIGLFGYWMKLYEDHGGEVNIVSSIDLGTLAKVIRTGATDKAKAVFDWLFSSDHYRAVYLRSKGMVNPAVVVSTKKLDANYALSQQKALPPLPKSVQKRSAAIPSFDADGNIIGGNNG